MAVGSPILALAALGILAGLGMLAIFRWTSKPDAIRRAKARMAAHLYEMRLFPDEPGLIWKAQISLLAANVRYLGLMLAPALVMSLPMAVAFYWLDGYFGYRPLAPGKDAIVTVRLKAPLSGEAPEIRAGEGVAVETAAVRLAGGREITWRIRASETGAGKLQIVFPGEIVDKSVDAGNTPRHVSRRRVSSLSALLLHPAEKLLRSERVDWIEIRYPETSVAAMGLELPWAAWTLLFATITALGLKSRFGVTF